jgi:hypothetical protein
MSSWTIVPGRADLSAPEKLALGTEILVAYARVRWWLWRADFRRAVAALRGHREGASRANVAEPEIAGRRLAHAVVRTLRVLPTDSRCLMRSLVLTTLLARRDIDSQLVLGVRPGVTFMAHAWVECGRVPLLDPAQAKFERLLEL